MGTNVYLRRRVPRMAPTYDEVHVCKLSAGWRAHFDGSSAAGTSWDWDDDPHRPRVGSMDDLRGYLESGEWELVDEYDEPTTLEEVLAHDEYKRDGRLWNTRVNPNDYIDREGHPWSREEFS